MGNHVKYVPAVHSFIISCRVAWHTFVSFAYQAIPFSIFTMAVLAIRMYSTLPSAIISSVAGMGFLSVLSAILYCRGGHYRSSGL
jgi:hypothetical protein